MKIKLKKRRYKPLYKKFISLRKNVQNRRRLNLFKFNKKKWNRLIGYLKRLQRRRKKKYRMYDISRYHLPKFYNSFKKKYNYIQQTRKKIKLFYGDISKRVLKKYASKTYKQKSKILANQFNIKSFFLCQLEKRLDSVLYRSHFVLSFRAGRQLISHKHVTINNKIVTDSSYILQKGDVIQISKNAQSLIDYNVKKSHIWPLPPKYLQINYKTLQILFLDNIETSNFSTYFPFWIDIYTLLRYYK